ncbi:acyl-CoA dehydrogenase family protein [Streptomyces clavuligerus]|uniref:acyl-CoA dehydrogenase family protein n=1 Tax=Streptomyces clavuligerus TaxID=1901 RepID=UPI00020D92E8|nr:acyl-CoA dehydrogenase family protein [Streptomyces clavuligerus]WDN57402.1 acyl-CoA dehydrogenase family protein [Streptomyces clavuligerus]
MLTADTTAQTVTPTREELVSRASEVAGTLREHAGWSEENRRPHDDTVQALADAGIFRMRVPARYGGYESDATTLCEVAAELGRADGSAAWTAAVYSIPTWMTGLFPDETQAEVFATPDVRICGTLSPTAQAVPAEGGIVVDGRWGFITGALHAQWQIVVAVLMVPGGEPAPVMALVPMDDLTIVDDWHTAGLKGTGSVTTIAERVFVPQARVMPMGAVIQGQSASPTTAAGALHRAPLLPVASASSVGPVLGMAKGALDAFLHRLPDRKITYTSYGRQSDAALTHLQVADAVMRIDEAEFHVRRLAGQVDAKAAEASEWTLAERVRARADMGAACRLAKEAVDILNTASGASSIRLDVPIQRFQRDIQAVCLHALMHPDTNAELYGRFLCGLEPDTLYL